jgi:hypothetical protein
MPDLLRDIGLLFAGVAMGSAITPEMLKIIDHPKKTGNAAVMMTDILTGDVSVARGLNIENKGQTFGSMEISQLPSTG